jgi:hypothetical protein
MGKIGKTFALFLILIVVTSCLSLLAVKPATAQGTTINTSFLPDISITPYPASLGQQITIIKTISPAPPSGYYYDAIRVSVIDSNGNYRLIGVNYTQLGTGTFCFSWIPDIPGTYLFIFTYPGEKLAGNVFTSCQSNNSISIGASLQTPALTPPPTSTSSPPSLIETSLNVNCQSSTTFSNFKVNIQGTLTASNSGLSDSSIQLSYSADGGNSWTLLTLVSTDETGGFQAVWTPMVTGNYCLRASYEGSSELSPASTIVHFAVLPLEDNSVFSVTSNSSVTALAFNSTTQELCFKVSGETGTTGYINVYISKSLMSNDSSLKVYFDQKLLQPATQSAGDSWLVSFTYHHSSHFVTLVLNSGKLNIDARTQNLYYVIAGVAGAILAIVVVMVLLKSKSKLKSI